MKKPDATPHWKNLMDHIDKAWLKKKGIHYPFRSDTMMLKRLKWLSEDYGAWGVMAAWDIYMEGHSFWSRKKGFDLNGFFSDLAVLVDDPLWKPKSQGYLDKLEPINGDVKNLIGGIPKQ